MPDRDYWGQKGGGILPMAEETGRFLLGLRSQMVNEPGRWGVWGGKCDAEHESTRQAARREFFEETGYGGSVDLSSLFLFEDQGFQYETFLGRIEQEFTPSLNWENSDYRWMTPDELQANYNSLHYGLQHVMDAKFEKLERESQQASGSDRESSLKDNLIRLGSRHPDLQSDLKPVIDRVDKEAASYRGKVNLPQAVREVFDRSNTGIDRVEAFPKDQWANLIMTGPVEDDVVRRLEDLYAVDRATKGKKDRELIVHFV